MVVLPALSSPTMMSFTCVLENSLFHKLLNKMPIFFSNVYNKKRRRKKVRWKKQNATPLLNSKQLYFNSYGGNAAAVESKLHFSFLHWLLWPFWSRQPINCPVKKHQYAQKFMLYLVLWRSASILPGCLTKSRQLQEMPWSVSLQMTRSLYFTLYMCLFTLLFFPSPNMMIRCIIIVWFFLIMFGLQAI